MGRQIVRRQHPFAEQSIVSECTNRVKFSLLWTLLSQSGWAAERQIMMVREA